MHIYIIIPYHGETRENYCHLLESINNQSGIDFSDVSICITRSDGLYTFPDISEWENLIPITKFISRPFEVSGPGQSRQVALDWIRNGINKSDWGTDGIIFCDCDDRLYDQYVLFRLFSWVPLNPDYDIMEFEAVTVSPDGTEKLLPTETIRWSLWGKLYRTSTMFKRNVKFALNVRSQEDFYFNFCMRSYKQTRYYSFRNINMYIHNPRDDSEGATLIKNRKFEDWLDDFIGDWNNYMEYIKNVPCTDFEPVFLLNLFKDIPHTAKSAGMTSEIIEKIKPVYEQYKSIVEEYRY